ncbi:MAG: hypothetical protein A2X61_01100 [Ignavibacteria bacterium GWB2_35_12]|nr:MAG: hypothetical protein A2X63_13770 [Ignavibacteria bacterium GWA2_35_8]OGU39077.1 MAG: hypothetical protein A2X61_01100 [Ignavibacteria bacterium GWB2_35_12]OGU87924.1 MAG: hypothetical protein A2220_10425 [Ignavibacteria bacterium RIFOXYA2_FULL_35_10]OGV21786.1 MAG: hypothetical protein A2475_04325 [Ignavibacteria bacterium RIFOXYC2_FULL_35_21]
MNRIIRINIFLFYLIIFSLRANSGPNPDSMNTCKERLPNEINSYQPVLVPLLTPDGRRIYYDRKWHPKNINSTNDQDDIWYSDRISQGIWSEPKNLTELNTFDSDVLFWISPDGRIGLVYGIYSDKHIQKKQGFSFSEYDGNNWSKPESLNIKNFYNDSLHFYANLSADGKILIMSVSRKDAVGGLDLYVSFLNEKTQEWSAPLNMGKEINTKGNEETPYLAYDNKTLYFSSNGYKGEGEQDLYFSRRPDDSWKRWSKPQNLGKGINTKFGEQGICLTALGDSAIIVSYDSVSKRKGLYWICLPKEAQPEPYTIVSGDINIKNNNDKITDVNIFVNDLPEQKIRIGLLKNYSIVIPEKKIYKIRVEAENFSTGSFEFDSRDIKWPQIIKYDFNLEQIKNINEKFIIYFDTDSYELNEENKKIIDEFYKEYRKNKIQISGYADETGTEDYNMILSMKRAKQVRDYLVNKGLKIKNIQINAMGEKEPISEDYSKNRRVEIIIK